MLDLLTTEILHPDSQAPNGVKNHFVEIFLEELTKVGAKEVRWGGCGVHAGAHLATVHLLRLSLPHLNQPLLSPLAHGGTDAPVCRALLWDRRLHQGVGVGAAWP